MLALALALTACATAPVSTAPANAPVPVPEAWAERTSSAAAPGSAPASLERWWQRFNDPALTGLVEQAAQFNTDVRSAQAALRQARAVRDVAAAGLQPTLDASASAQRSRTGGNASNLFQAGFDAAWEPDIFGAAHQGVAAAEADAGASAANLADVQVSIAAEVAVDYMQLRGYQARSAIARANLASQEETLQIARWRTQAGLATSLEVEQARAATEQTRAQIPALEASVAQSEHALAVLTGRVPGSLRAQLSGSGTLPAPPDDLALRIPAETLRQRPDVRGAEQQIRAAEARVAQADAARYPSFKLSGSIGLSALALGSLTGGGSVVSAVLGSASVPILDGGAAQAQVRAKDAALEQARIHYQAVVLGALKDVEDALVALRTTRERLATLRLAAEAADNAALLARQRYASGLVDFLTVLETQRTLLSTQDSVATAESDLGADHVRLYKALGGGWQPDAAAAPGAVSQPNTVPDAAASAPTSS